MVARRSQSGSDGCSLFWAAYVRAVSGGKVGASEPYLMSHGNPYSTDSFPAHELTVRCLGAMTNGSFTPGTDGGPAGDLRHAAGNRARRDTFTHLEQEPWAALLVSESTRQFYAYGNIVERWLAHAVGVYRMGMEEHLPITLITELELKPEVLDQYRVLILPNVACLSDQQVQTIRDYVTRGGGLVATGETSLCDELGRPRGDFALKDLFGTSYGGRPAMSTAAPFTRFDAGLVEGHPFATAALTTLERERDMGRVSCGVRLAPM